MRRSHLVCAIEELGPQGFQFSCAKDRGAVLIINSEARRKDSEQRGAFKKYMLKNYKSWYTFANTEPHSRDISLSDLVFVTGAHIRVIRESADRCHSRSRQYRRLGRRGIFRALNVRYLTDIHVKARLIDLSPLFVLKVPFNSRQVSRTCLEQISRSGEVGRG